MSLLETRVSVTVVSLDYQSNIVDYKSKSTNVFIQNASHETSNISLEYKDDIAIAYVTSRRTYYLDSNATVGVQVLSYPKPNVVNTSYQFSSNALTQLFSLAYNTIIDSRVYQDKTASAFVFYPYRIFEGDDTSAIVYHIKCDLLKTLIGLCFQGYSSEYLTILVPITKNLNYKISVCTFTKYNREYIVDIQALISKGFIVDQVYDDYNNPFYVKVIPYFGVQIS